MAIRLSVVIVIVLFTVSIPITTNAQQPPPPTTTTTTSKQAPTTTSSPTQNATLFQSTEDSFRLQVPRGWVIHDIDNTGSALLTEVMQGYGILAQLCPETGQQQPQIFRNVSSSRCQQTQQTIYVIRYPNLGAKLGIGSGDDIFSMVNRSTIPNPLLAYHMQKLNEAGYEDIQIVNSTDRTVNVIIGSSSMSLSSNNAIATTKVPAKLVEITYRTNSAPNQTRTGYFILTATAATPRNLGTITGYSLFYEGNSIVSSNKTETSSTIPSGSPGLPRPLPTTTTTVLPPQTTPTVPLPAAVRQVFDSFQLIAAPTEPLRVEITSSDTEGVAPATFRFEAHVTGGMEPYSFSWSFGDGSGGSSNSQETDDDNNNTIRHTFDRAGTYNVDVTVTDSTGRTAFDNIEINVKEAPVATEQPPNVHNFLDDLIDNLGLT